MERDDAAAEVDSISSCVELVSSADEEDPVLLAELLDDLLPEPAVRYVLAAVRRRPALVHSCIFIINTSSNCVAVYKYISKTLIISMKIVKIVNVRNDQAKSSGEKTVESVPAEPVSGIGDCEFPESIDLQNRLESRQAARRSAVNAEDSLFATLHSQQFALSLILNSILI